MSFITFIFSVHFYKFLQYKRPGRNRVFCTAGLTGRSLFSLKIQALSGAPAELIFTFLRFAVNASIYAVFSVGELENVIKSPFLGSDTSRILAADNIGDLLWKLKVFLFHNGSVFDVTDGNIRINVTKHIQIQVQIIGDLNNIFFAHLAADRILNDSDAAVQFVETKIFVNFHAFARFNMV